MIDFKNQLTFIILPWSRIRPCWSMNGENWNVLLFFGIYYSALRDLISSAYCSCCISLKMLDCATSLSSTFSVRSAGLCFLNTRCTFAFVVTSRLKLLNSSQGITGFFSSIFAEKTIWSFCTSEAKIKLTCSGHLFSACFNQASPVSGLLPLRSSTLIACVPVSAGLLIPLT